MTGSPEPDEAASGEPPRAVLYAIYATSIVVLIVVLAVVGAYVS